MHRAVDVSPGGAPHAALRAGAPEAPGLRLDDAPLQVDDEDLQLCVYIYIYTHI